ncbi:FAD-dependent oxidoreductase [Longimycelium tulufanense]|uniref:FAD-dependent oxidoreductase n=1 Tax=Longimycelium tulufanense TaxID=907463 RepID=A0A8J3FZM1_9PSEU|nr:FAD-dependent monooxygenase [Longimycelium tulufanense]GGM81722.1 FAD-dependent oxidoreductase [Longimycelium tulufanense]
MTTALIAGAGIAGCATALALHKAGIYATLYEAYPAGADQAGAFLMIMPNGMDALQAIDAHQTVIEASFPTTRVEHLDHHGQRLSVRQVGNRDGLDARTLTRAQLYRALRQEVLRRGAHIHHGTQLLDAKTNKGTVTAVFADGTMAEGDLLIGADGVHSATRTIIDPDAPRPRYTGQVLLFGTTRNTSIPTAPGCYRMIHGRRALFGYTTSPQQKTLWFTGIEGPKLTPQTLTATPPGHWRSHALDHLAGDDSPAAQIVYATEDAHIQATTTYDVATIPTWHTPTMVLVGDAAHAASPSAAQGASMALEDSVILAQCLRDLPQPQALDTYVRLRRDRVERLVAFSAHQAADHTTMLREEPDSRDWLYSHHVTWGEPIG